MLLGLLAASALAADGLYDKLAEACQEKGSVSCCLSSVKRMKANGWKPAPEKGCPKGTTPDMLKCEDSFRWCVPDEPKPAARLSRKKAIALAKRAIRGKVSYPPDTPIEVRERGKETIVTFKTVLKPGTLGADYHAQVTLDSKTGKVVQVLGSQD